MPIFYIGSSSVKKVQEGYCGSVESKKYKDIWISELKLNRHLFETIILFKFNSREAAYKKELELQIQYNVIKNKNFINMSLARANGYFGATGNKPWNFGLTKYNHSSIESSASKRRGRSRFNDLGIANASIKLSKLNQEQKILLVKLRNEGMPFKKIHEILGVDIDLSNLYKNYKKELKSLNLEKNNL